MINKQTELSSPFSSDIAIYVDCKNTEKGKYTDLQQERIAVFIN